MPPRGYFLHRHHIPIASHNIFLCYRFRFEQMFDKSLKNQPRTFGVSSIKSKSILFEVGLQVYTADRTLVRPENPSFRRVFANGRRFPSRSSRFRACPMFRSAVYRYRFTSPKRSGKSGRTAICRNTEPVKARLVRQLPKRNGEIFHVRNVGQILGVNIRSRFPKVQCRSQCE